MKEVGGTGVGLAVFAGEAVWSGGESQPGSIERMTALVELAALTPVATTLWMMASANLASATLASTSTASLVAPAAGTLSLAAIATRPVRVLLRHPPRREAGFWVSVGWRSVAVLVLAMAIVVNAPDWGALLAIPLGIAAGAEAVLSAWALGVEVIPRRWWAAILRSPLNFGAIGALLAGLLQLGWSDGRATVVVMYAAFLGFLAVLVVAAAMLDRVRSEQLAEDRRQTEATIAEEHRRRAHWLHDDVSSELRIVSMRVQHEDATPSEVVSMLDQLDHTIRLRQLDEVIRSGTARLAEIIQPYVRRAQAHGVTITSVPGFERASLVVNAATAQLVARATALFTSNALNAGATEIGYELAYDAETVRVAVSDDAGGFDLAEAPAGRGLWQLDRVLGPGRLTATRTDRGTTVTATISRDTDTPLEDHDGDAAAG